MTVSIYMAQPPTEYPSQPFTNPHITPQFMPDPFLSLSLKLDAIRARLDRIEDLLVKKPRARSKRKKRHISRSY